MDRNEQGIIDGLFDKLGQAERGSGPRDAEAERRIEEHLRRQPAAPYYMAQAVIVQEHALQAAQERIQQLEQELKQRPAGGGFLGGLFGAGSVPARRPAPSPQLGQLAQYQQRGGSGFLAGAMQTAMGVAGGVLLGNLLMGAFSGGDAMAAEAEGLAEDAAGGFEDAGADFGDMDEEF
jgi:hypothetical protein